MLSPTARARRSRTYILVALITLSLCSIGFSQTTGDQFTVILLPDTQFYSAKYPYIFNSQTQWIASHVADRNIKFVLGLGDIVDDGTKIAQWQNATAAASVLNNQVPFFFPIGNKDYQGTIGNRTVTNFNAYFGPARYAGYSWYKGGPVDEGTYPPGSNENFYGIVNVNGKDMLLVMLEFLPRNEALAWAANVLNDNAEKEAIVVTHSFMNTDNTRVDICDSPGNYALTGNRGEDMWYNFVQSHPNIILTLNGHTSYTGRRQDLGLGGNLVNQVLSDYQNLTNGGNGYLRILTFNPSLNTIDVQTYSPYLNTYMTDAANQFTIPYHSPGPLGSTGKIQGRLRVAMIGSTQDCASVASGSISAPPKSTLSASNGSYTLSSLTPNSYQVTASKTDFQSQTLTTQVNGGYTSRLEFFMTPVMGTIAGTVTNSSGAPVAGASVNIRGGVVVFNKTVKTDSGGNFSSGKIAVGSYTLTITAPNAASTTSTATVSDSSTTTVQASVQ